MVESYTKKAVRSTVTIFLIGIASLGVSYLFRLLLARNLSVAEYGLFYSIISFFFIFVVITRLGLGQALVKYISEFLVKKQFAKVKGSIMITLWTHFILSIIVGVIFILISGFLATHYLKMPGYHYLIVLYAIYFIFFPFQSTLSYTFKGFQKMHYYSVMELFQNVIVFVFTFLFLIVFNMGLKSPFVAHYFIFILPVIFAPIFFKKHFPKFTKVKATITRPLFNKLTIFGISMVIMSVSTVIFSNADTILITFFLSLEDVGLYQAAFPTTKILANFSTTLLIVLLPLTSELWARKKFGVLKEGVKDLYKYAALILIPACFTMIIFPDLIIRILFGPAYEPAANVLRILAVAALINVSGGINSGVLSGIGKHSIVGKIFLSAAILNIVLNIILIPIIGIEGAAIATLISFAIISVWTFVSLKKSVGIKFDIRALIFTLISGAIFTFIILILKSSLHSNVWIELAVSLIVALVAYVILLFVLRVVSLSEIRNLIHRIKG